MPIFKHQVPPRPALEGRCYCVWPDEYERRAQIQAAYTEAQDRLDAITNPIAVVSGLPSAVANAASDAYRSSMPGALGGGSAVTPLPTHVTIDVDVKNPLEIDFNEANGVNPSSNHARVATKAETLQIKPDVDAKAIEEETQKRLDRKRLVYKENTLSKNVKKDNFTRTVRRTLYKSPEMKLRDLLSYREDLVIILSSLIPTYTQQRTMSPLTGNHTRLCEHCLTTLGHLLYHSPARLAPYITESATRAFLTLVDDACTSIACDVRMEQLSHHELEQTVRGELAVVEWRMAIKIAALHKHTQIADLFPMKIGQFAELTTDRAPAARPDGILAKSGRKVAGWMGMGSSPTKHSQVRDAVKAKASLS